VLNTYRAAVLGIATFEPVARLVRRHGFRLGARRFVAGHDVAEALPALEALAAAGRHVIVDVLGEYVADTARARAMAADVVATVEALAAAGIPPVISVKPTQFGLALDAALATELTAGVAGRAEALGGRIALDMEDARYTDATLELVRSLWRAGQVRTAGVLQAYLHRTPDDLEALIADAPDAGRLELRVVKGAYHEPPTVALHDPMAIHAAFVALTERAWRAGAKVDVATHDERIIAELQAFARGARLPAEQVEFQLLYGIATRVQASLVASGQTVRVYVPIGRDWYGYFSRRLAERPANLALVLRGLARS
jgi:proline dehydrogenase